MTSTSGVRASDVSVIGQRLLSPRTVRAYGRVAADVATAGDDGTAYLGRARNARVRPDHGILDHRLFLDMHAGTDNRIDDLCTGFDRAAFADHRRAVDLGVRRNVRAVTALEVETGDPARKEILMRLQIAGRRADVEPVFVFDDRREKGKLAFQQIGKTSYSNERFASFLIVSRIVGSRT